MHFGKIQVTSWLREVCSYACWVWESLSFLCDFVYWWVVLAGTWNVLSFFVLICAHAYFSLGSSKWKWWYVIIWSLLWRFFVLFDCIVFIEVWRMLASIVDVHLARHVHLLIILEAVPRICRYQWAFWHVATKLFLSVFQISFTLLSWNAIGLKWVILIKLPLWANLWEDCIATNLRICLACGRPRRSQLQILFELAVVESLLPIDRASNRNVPVWMRHLIILLIYCLLSWSEVAVGHGVHCLLILHIQQFLTIM